MTMKKTAIVLAALTLALLATTAPASAECVDVPEAGATVCADADTDPNDGDVGAEASFEDDSGNSGSFSVGVSF